jgi:hypothetical protein
MASGGTAMLSPQRFARFHRVVAIFQPDGILFQAPFGALRPMDRVA